MNCITYSQDNILCIKLKLSNVHFIYIIPEDCLSKKHYVICYHILLRKEHKASGKGFYVSIPLILFSITITAAFTCNSRIFFAATYTGSDTNAIATLETHKAIKYCKTIISDYKTVTWQHIKTQENIMWNYFVFSSTIVDREGLNTRSLNVSMKVFGADKNYWQ